MYDVQNLSYERFTKRIFFPAELGPRTLYSNLISGKKSCACSRMSVTCGSFFVYSNIVLYVHARSFDKNTRISPHVKVPSAYMQQWVARRSPIRHSPTAKVPGVYWRKYGGLSPIGEIPRGVLAKFHRVYWRKYSGLSSLAKILLAKFRNPAVTYMRVHANIIYSVTRSHACQVITIHACTRTDNTASTRVL